MYKAYADKIIVLERFQKKTLSKEGGGVGGHPTLPSLHTRGLISFDN